MGVLSAIGSIGSGGVLAPIMAGVGLLSTVAGSIVQSSAAGEQASAEQASANYQAAVAQNQATLYKQQASQQMAVGEAQANQSQMQSRAQYGAIKAAIGASGVDVNTGSAADVLQSQQRLGTLNSLTIQSNAARQAWGSEEAATSAQAQSGLYSQEAAQAPISGQYASEAALLSGASGVAKQYNQWSLASGGLGGASSGGPTYATGGWAGQPGTNNAVVFS